MVFSELVQRCEEAHERSDTEELRKIYGYAEWCFRGRDRDLWIAAGVSFYEHLGDRCPTRQEIPYWVKQMRTGKEEEEKLRGTYERPHKQPRWPPIA